MKSMIRCFASLLCVLAPVVALAQQLTVSAAASMTDAFKEIVPRFEAAHPGVTVRMNFGASGTLLQQIRVGAPVDVFVSADAATVTHGIDAGIFDGATQRTLATNTLVLVVPAGDASPVKSLAALADPAVRRIAIGKIATVPCGRYTQQALERAKLWGALGPKIVESDSVRQVLDYVARAEADAGFVYRTDAMLMPDRVAVVQTVDDHDPVVYPVVAVRASSAPALAKAFIAYLFGPDAQAILKRYGFTHA
ncbi:molybdate ABC transporter substrate-binding protein [Burkholderia vietnamiensis]|uniref:Molybdate ABC transporter substrate-binding protein n=1 Tax=Burkholderia vietnamiensis TaxID=60552 RepID=A0A132DQ96_BURVI|nr:MULTISPECIES: molybdate ABC transporter substrate-binding protein [Burkholderia]AFJ89867.1 Molybdenum ABC transporter, periplasmic molybdenum-binding protein ModA [Burkholderia sp. KJ006]KVE08802.1 molybdate ABC transporter substrate-binding protein [Burkholderia vietnamiensis]KVF80397.1 molybdate ABC transporter substrate-binding protein [Burkholderia vietnamiensis]KVF85584.1 molybdate ABC transporter substrate-binding protein [Burkholderia vietnamiensis]KVF94205.1 molybdate ABC transporte